MKFEDQLKLEELARVARLREDYGYWKEHPDFPTEDWITECDNNETRQGYWEWVDDQIRNRE